MGRKLTKKQKNQLKQKHQKKKVKKLENLDAKGISRKKYKLVMSPKTFFIMKIVGIISVPVIYFVYSPLLVVSMLYFIGLFFAAIGLEHSLNKSVIRSNHIKIPKYDSAIALVLTCVAFFGTVFNTAGTKVGMMANTVNMTLTKSLNNFGTLLTGVRSVFSSNRQFNFGSMERPEGFIADREGMMDRFEGMERPPQGNFEGFSGRPMRMEIDMDNIPVEFMFTQLLSTIATVLLVSVVVFSIISLYFTYKKMKRFEQQQDEVIVDGDIIILNDEEILRILDFGEIEDPIIV